MYYFHGMLPVFSHDENDRESFRFITSQLVVGGKVQQVEIVKAFGVSSISVKRSVKRLRQEGCQGFFKERKSRGPHVLTPEVVKKAQGLLVKGQKPPEVAKKLGLKASTLRKAIQAGRLHVEKEGDKGGGQALSKSQRNVVDAQSTLGMGCSRELERIQAACGGLQGAAPEFTPNKDVTSA